MKGRLVKHEKFNIYGRKEDVAELTDMIVENEKFLERAETKQRFVKSLGGQYKYLDLGNYNGKKVQLLLNNKKGLIEVLYNGEHVADMYISKGLWHLYVKNFSFDTSECMMYKATDSSTTGSKLLAYAVTIETMFMYETEIDAYQYFYMQDEGDYGMGCDDGAYEFHNGINSGVCSSCGDGGCVHCEPHRFL